jgi:UbiD family decarboxylase
VAQIAKQKAEDGIRVIKQIFDCGMPNKVIIVVDEDVDIYSHKDVWWAIATRFQPDRDVVIGRDMPGLGIDPSTIQTESISSGAKVLVTTTSKIGLDATKPLDDPDKFERIRIPTEIRRRVEGIVGAAKAEHERHPR